MKTHPIDAWIKRHNKTKVGFSKEIGFTRQTLWRLLKGDRSFTLHALFKISAATGNKVTVNDLVDATKDDS